MSVPAPGRLITFEGGEGSGKTTQIALLSDYLRANHVSVLTLREPGGTVGAESIRSLLVEGDVSRWDAMSEALLLYAARHDLVTKVILPALAQGTWVLCDRFMDSTLAYQGFGHGLDVEKITFLQRHVLGDFEPDLTFWFDMAPSQGLARTQQRAGSEDRFERMDPAFHERVRQGFAHLAHVSPHRFVRIDADQSIEAIQSILQHTLHTRFEGLGA